MAEKRKQPPRAGREPAAKRRVSEAVTPQSSKKKVPTPRVPSQPPEPVEAPLPTKLKDGEPLPVRRARQPESLSDTDYQSIAERFDHQIRAKLSQADRVRSCSGVLLASLERSKKKWLSDGILVRYYTKPKKTKREQIERNNPPKDSMVKVGLCDVTIGPHYFDAMMYTVKDPNAHPQPLQYAPPRPMMHYNGPNNFQRYPPYPSPNQQRPPYSPASSGRPPQGHQTPQQRGPQHGPSGQRPSQAPNGQPSQPAKPSPDPVIQMLATRAAADPELKALMRVVASSQASQEQLRAFQAHIDELNAIIKAREQQQSAARTSTPQPASQPGTPASQEKATPSQPESQQKQELGAKTSQEQGSKSQAAAETPSKESEKQPASSESKAAPATSPSEGTQSGSQSETPAQTQPPATSQGTTAPIKQEPGTNNPQATSTAAQPSTSTPSATPGPVGSPAPNVGSQPQGSAAHPVQTPGNFQPPPRPGQAYTPQPPIQSRPPQYGSPTPYYRPPAPPQAPARVAYKAVVFEFTSPLTPYGNVNSGHAGSGDRYLFPEHSILEWIPNENVILASFLVVRKVDPSKPFPIEPEGEPATSRGKGKASKSKKGKGKDASEPPTPSPANPTGTPQKTEPTDKTGVNPNLAVPGTPGASGTPRQPAVNEANLKEYWQPVTFRIHASNPRILEPLTRVVKPADEVRKYMNEIMDRAERAPDGFPTFRLPREEAHEAFESEGTPASVTNLARNRPSRAAIKAPEEESEVENMLDVEEEEDLLDFYGSPMGLPPLKA